MGRRIAYHRASADAAYWDDHWEDESLTHLLDVAEHSPLTAWLERHLPAGGRVLEAGCGVGQYVHLLGERGFRMTGVDYAERALERGRAAWPGADLEVADLTDLPFADGSFDAYVSLGVIEHFEDGPDAVLAEARRVLAPGGVALVSVPFLNLSRRLLRRRIRARERDVMARGGAFYQFAMDERALDGLLASAGLRVATRGFYDPGRGLRDVRALLRPPAPAVAPPPAAPRPDPPPVRPASPLKRRLLYATPTLKTLAHMQIVAAR